VASGNPLNCVGARETKWTPEEITPYSAPLVIGHANPALGDVLATEEFALSIRTDRLQSRIIKPIHKLAEDFESAWRTGE
jgi:hypothetical protein